MAKTPFNEENEARFNNAGLRIIDLCEMPDGNLVAFSMPHIKRGDVMNPENSVVVCKLADIKPEALELLMSSPLLWRALFAANMGLERIREAAEHMQYYLRTKRGVSDPSVDFIVNECHKIENMALAAMNVPVMGRDAAIKNYQAPDESNG